MQNIRLRQLRAYQAIMNAGTVSDAAESLFLSQSSVSRLLASLELEIGFQLFDRRGRRLVPSVEGRRFYQRIEGTLAAIDDISTIAEDVRQSQGLRLRICAIGPLLFSRFLADALKRFSDRYPETMFTVEQRRRIEIEEWMSSRQADLGLTLLPVDSPSVSVEPIATVAAVAIVPPRHPLAGRDTLEPDDLFGQPVILPRQSVRLRQMADSALLSSGVRFGALSETSSALASCHMVAQGLGIGISDPFSVAGLPEDAVRVARWLPELKLTYGAIWLRSRPPSRQTLDLIGQLKAVADEITTKMPAASPTGAG